jgi:hypothetical protein
MTLDRALEIVEAAAVQASAGVVVVVDEGRAEQSAPRPPITAEFEQVERLSRDAMACEATGDTARALGCLSEAHTMLDLWRARLGAKQVTPP